MSRNPARFDLAGDHAIIQGADWFKPFRVLTDQAYVTPFVGNAPYLVGDYVRPTGTQTGFVYLVIASSGDAGTEPISWATVRGGRNSITGIITIAVPEGEQRLLDTTGYGAEMKVRTSADAVSPSFTATTGNGRMFVGFDPPQWQASHVYAAGDLVIPSYVNGWVYECVDAGTSAATETGSWPTVLGGQVDEGGVTWRCVSEDTIVSNLRISLTHAYTETLTNWGLGLFDIELTDLFSKKQRIVEGAAVLSEEMTK